MRGQAERGFDAAAEALSRRGKEQVGALERGRLYPQPAASLDDRRLPDFAGLHAQLNAKA